MTNDEVSASAEGAAAVANRRRLICEESCNQRGTTFPALLNKLSDFFMSEGKHFGKQVDLQTVELCGTIAYLLHTETGATVEEIGALLGCPVPFADECLEDIGKRLADPSNAQAFLRARINLVKKAVEHVLTNGEEATTEEAVPLARKPGSLPVFSQETVVNALLQTVSPMGVERAQIFGKDPGREASAARRVLKLLLAKLTPLTIERIASLFGEEKKTLAYAPLLQGQGLDQLEEAILRGACARLNVNAQDVKADKHRK